MSIPSLSPQGTYGTSRDLPWYRPSTQSSVPPVHPIPQSPMDIWDIKGPPMVSLSKILCPTCPSHSSLPKGHMGHQHNSHILLHALIYNIKPSYACNHILISVLGRLSNCLKHWPVERDYIRCPSLSMHPERWDGQLGQRPTDETPWKVPSLSICPLGTEGWDRAGTEDYRGDHMG